MTKEELIKKVARLEGEADVLDYELARTRQEFARAFGWHKKGMYAGDDELETPTWEEIFVELGKLLAERKDLGLRDELYSLQTRVDELYRQKLEEESKTDKA